MLVYYEIVLVLEFFYEFYGLELLYYVLVLLGHLVFFVGVDQGEAEDVN